MALDFAAMLREAREKELGQSSSSPAAASNAAPRQPLLKSRLLGDRSTAKHASTGRTGVSHAAPAAAASIAGVETQIEIDAYCALPLYLEPLSAPPPASLSAHLVRASAAPPTCIYVPDFISAIDERRMLDLAAAAPACKWTTLSARRLQNWGGTPTPQGLLAEPLPAWLEALVDRVAQFPIFGDALRPNHVLLNQYRSGEGIMTHKDGPAYHPIVVILSLGSSTSLDFFDSLADTKVPGAEVFSLFLRPRSLLIFSEECYTRLFHSIAEVRTTS